MAAPQQIETKLRAPQCLNNIPLSARAQCPDMGTKSGHGLSQSRRTCKNCTVLPIGQCVVLLCDCTKPRKQNMEEQRLNFRPTIQKVSQDVPMYSVLPSLNPLHPHLFHLAILAAIFAAISWRFHIACVNYW